MKTLSILSLVIIAVSTTSCSLDPFNGGFLLPDRGDINYNWDTYPVAY